MASRILPFLALFIESYADCEEGGTCHATSNVLLQRKREELSQQMVYESTYDGGDSGPMLMDGHFTLSYDPSVYCCDEATIKDMQQKGFVSFQEGLAELLGFGLTSADLVDLQFVPNPANHSEVDVKFLFKCPAALSAAEMQAEMQKITTLRLLGTLKAKMSDHGLNPAAFHMGILPVTASYKPLPHSTSSPTTSWSYTTTIGGVVVEVTGRFTVSYDPGLYTGNATEVAALQEKSQTAFKTAIAAALGAPIQASDLTLRWERISPALLQTRQTQGTLSEAICFFTIHSRTETASDLEQKVNGMDQTALEQSVLSEMTAHGVPTAHMAVVSPITVELNTGTIPGTTTGSSWVVSTTPLSTTPFSTTPFSTTFSTTTTSSFRMEDVHPCASFEDFTPEKRTSDYGWCEGDNFIVDNQTETACINAGCMSYAPYCWCDDEAKCQSLGMPWKYHTCEMEVSMYMHGEYAALISAAHERKSCAGLETSWHQNIAEVIEWSARMCCKSWPKKLCDPTAVMVTPCKDPSDFMPDTPYDPSYPGQSCSDTMRSWYSEYTAMENATKAGSCAGISLSWGEELTRWVTYPAKQCCNSSPATLCQPHLRKVSFCAAESDFHPELNVHEWCEHSNGIPDEASCAAAGCIAHHGGTHCECRSASSCQASSGAWRTQTCAENAQWMHDDPVMLEALMAAENGTDCADISVHGRTLMDYISYSVQKCCSSFPASICHKNAQKMSQCKSLSSFLPAALVWSHCWSTDSVSEDACMMPGLRCSWSGSHCHCDDRSSCEAVNGTWEEFTCAQEVDTWDMTIHLTVQEALDTDDCELQAYGRKVSQVIATASSCCSDWPASVCAKTAELVTPCKTSADYLPSHALHSWCDMYGRNPADCHAHGCTPTHSSCHCETQETCEAAGAIWRSNSCADEVKWQSPGWHEAMKIARDTDSCDGDLNGLTVKDATDHFARHCCASYPATLCDKDARKMTPCKDEQDFLKDKELPGGFCDFRSVPPASDVCTAHQCTESGGGCHCHERAPCEALGGTWKPYTCSDEVAAWGSEAMKALQDADEGKAQCPDLTMLGQAVQDAIAYTAQKCCASFPATVCDKTAKKMTPCQHTSDFLPDQVIWAYCHIDYQFTPNATVCNAQTDCQGDEHWCHCWSETGCVAVGGTWMEQTCRKEIDDYWRPEQHKVLQWAEGNGTCVDQVIDGWLRAEDQVWLASTCCSNFPSTLCDHDVEPMTPCKRHEDFLATKVRYSWCNVYPSPEESACIASGCKYEHSWCQCETEASCATAGGQFHSTNCTSEIQWWQADTHKAIKEAIDQGSCTGVETRWSPVENSVSWLGECCSSGMDVCQELASG